MCQCELRGSVITPGSFQLLFQITRDQNVFHFLSKDVSWISLSFMLFLNRVICAIESIKHSRVSVICKETFLWSGSKTTNPNISLRASLSDWSDLNYMFFLSEGRDTDRGKSLLDPVVCPSAVTAPKILLNTSEMKPQAQSTQKMCS